MAFLLLLYSLLLPAPVCCPPGLADLLNLPFESSPDVGRLHGHMTSHSPWTWLASPKLYDLLDRDEHHTFWERAARQVFLQGQHEQRQHFTWTVVNGAALERS